MSKQCESKGQQRISFTEEEAAVINAILDRMQYVRGKGITPNRFIKASTLDKADAINEGIYK